MLWTLHLYFLLSPQPSIPFLSPSHMELGNSCLPAFRTNVVSRASPSLPLDQDKNVPSCSAPSCSAGCRWLCKKKGEGSDVLFYFVLDFRKRKEVETIGYIKVKNICNLGYLVKGQPPVGHGMLKSQCSLCHRDVCGGLWGKLKRWISFTRIYTSLPWTSISLFPRKDVCRVRGSWANWVNMCLSQGGLDSDTDMLLSVSVWKDIDIEKA